MGSAVTTAIGKAEKRNYGLIDILKLLCAALVVAIHVPPFLDIHGLIDFAVVNYIARIAVPFFFVSSSYFLFTKAYDKVTGGIDKDVILKYALRIIREYANPFLTHLLSAHDSCGGSSFDSRFAKSPGRKCCKLCVCSDGDGCDIAYNNEALRALSCVPLAFQLRKKSEVCRPRNFFAFSYNPTLTLPPSFP